MQSEWLVCVQCEDEFEFSAADQIRYGEKGFEPPQRCPSCRRHKSKGIHQDGKRHDKSRKVLHRTRRDDDY